MPTKTTAPPAALNLVSDKPKEVGPNVHNGVVQVFLPNNGEIVIKLRNLTREKRYFVYTINETDVEGNVLSAPSNGDLQG